MDNMYNVDAAIHYILQLIYVAEETGFFSWAFIFVLFLIN